MKDILTVMKFTIKEMLKRKSFIVSTIIILILIVIGFNIPNIIKAVKGEETKQKILICDRENVFEGNLESLKNIDLGYDIELVDSEEETIKQKINEDQIDSAIVIKKADDNLEIKYLVKNALFVDNIPENIINTMSVIYSNMQVTKIGLTEEQIKFITPNFDVKIEQSTEKEAEGNVFVIMIMSMILFYAIYFCAYQVSSSITTEKTSKIMETLVTSTSPKTIVFGKTIGIGIVGLVQMILIVGTALISAKIFLNEELINSVLNVSNITLSLGIITIVYFILGYFEYAFLYALTGSTVSKPEDIQSANSPVAILAVAGFYLSYFTMMNPTSNLNIFASIFPISSPFCMPFRIMMGLASGFDIALSIIILLATILLIAKITIKIYSNAILNYGTKMSLKDVFNMYKSKN